MIYLSDIGSVFAAGASIWVSFFNFSFNFFGITLYVWEFFLFGWIIATLHFILERLSE